MNFPTIIIFPSHYSVLQFQRVAWQKTSCLTEIVYIGSSVTQLLEKLPGI